jgi:hypothetical protein
MHDLKQWLLQRLDISRYCRIEVEEIGETVTCCSGSKAVGK